MVTATASPSSEHSVTPGTILVVDDEPSICWAFEKMFQADGHEVMVASSAEEGLELVSAQPPDLILLDVRLPREDGISALPKFVAQSNHAPVVVMTAFGDLETAVSAVRNGATDYITKPFQLEDVSRVCQKALETGRGQSQTLPTNGQSRHAHKLVGTSAAMQLVFRQIAFVSSSDLSVLITGETGTGKELVAEAIHRNSLRADLPYLCVAPVALSEDLIESELFGHIEGAFTGAQRDRAGIFEQAEGGTVLLDEIGELPLNIQVKLLRVLEQGEYCRVGESVPRRCNVRILAATNRNLQTAVTKGTFREDLFYRLNGLQMHLPPLSNRREDIEPLCRHFLQQLSYPNAEPLSHTLVAELQTRPWHGNVRELRNAVQQAAVIARGRPLNIADFPVNSPARGDFASESDIVKDKAGDSHSNQTTEDNLVSAIAAWFGQQCRQRSTEMTAASFISDSKESTAAANAQEGLHAQFLSIAEPALFEMALKLTGGNRSKAAELLGIHRATLREKLRSHESNDGKCES